MKPLVNKYEFNILWLFAFSLPIFSAMRLAGFSVSRLLLIIYLLIFVTLMLDGVKRKLDSKLLIACLVYIGWMSISLLWTPNADIRQGIATTSVQQGMIRIFFSGCCVLMYCFVASTFFSNTYYSKILKALFWGGIVSAILLFIIGGDYYGEQGEVRYSLADGVDPNYYAMNLLVPLALSLGYVKAKKVTSYLPLFLILSAIIATGSRGAMIAVAAIIGVKLLSERKYFLLISLSVLTVLGLMSLAVIYPRFALESAMDGSGRTNIWIVMMSMIQDNFFTGVGVSGIRGVYDVYAMSSGVGMTVGHQRDAHNAYLEIFAELGIVGILSYLYIIYRSFALNYKQRLRNVNLNIGVIGCLVCVAAISSILEESIWFCLALLAMKVGDEV